MSLKEDIAIVKEEISTEEQFLTSSIKIERFFKKYKILLLAVLGVLVLSAISYAGYDYYEQERLKSANIALVNLMKNPQDKASEELLKSKSPKLHEAYAFAIAMAKNDTTAIKNSCASTNAVIADLSKYQSAASTGDENALRAYASSSDAILKDFANFLLAQKAIEKNYTKSAGELLAKIPASSNLKEQALYLEHLLLKTNKTK